MFDFITPKSIWKAEEGFQALPAENTMYYFAYGSNMNARRAARRMPGAYALGKAVLRGYELRERLYADIERKRGAKVEGVLYHVSPRNMAALDRFEGAPLTYSRIIVTVRYRGVGYRCWTYMMTDATRRQREGIPYPDVYRRICSAGALQHGVRDEFMKGKTAMHNVAAYGTLLRGERNERWASDALSRRKAFINGVLYDTGYGFPAFVPNPTGGLVEAEVLEVSDYRLERLDWLEGYPELYRREQIAAKLEDGGEVTAWVYVMNQLPDLATVIANGSWRNRNVNEKGKSKRRPKNVI